jgi:hypothetical protein
MAAMMIIPLDRSAQNVLKKAVIAARPLVPFKAQGLIMA